MAYNPTIWINDDGTGTVGTPVIANYLNNIEQGIKNNDEQINVLNEKFNRADISSSLTNGWVHEKTFDTDTITVSKSGGICCFNFKVVNPSLTQSWSTILNVPVGYRPKNHINFGDFVLYPSGDLQTTLSLSANTTLNINFVWEV